MGKRDKLERSLGGIAEMKSTPSMIFIIDTNIESLAIKEAFKLNIPIVAVIDTNSDPTGINYPIPGNDDARRAINLYCDLVKQTVTDAQKNISVKDPNEPSAKKDMVEIKEQVQKTPEKKPTAKKAASSILSKIKNLASKKLS